MGYRRPSKVYVLQFSDPELDGLEVRARGASVGQMMELMKLAEQVRQGATAGQVEELFALFAGRLLSWNLEDEDGAPVPTTLAGLTGQDMDFVMTMIFAWIDAIQGVPDPLAPNSGGGSPSPPEAPEVLSIPMEALSPSLAS